MAKFSKPVNSEVFEPTGEEIRDMRLSLRNFPLKKINGVLQGGFEQYCVSKGVLRFNDKGGLVVLNAAAYDNLREIHWKVRGIEWGEQERIFNAFPEERDKWYASIRGLFSDFNNLFKIK